MARILSTLFLVFIIHLAMAQNVGIGTNTPTSSAQLDVSSTTKGMLAPRMSTVQRNNIASPAKGLLVYDTDLNSLYHYNGSAWAAVGGGGGFTLPYEGTVNLGIPGLKVTNAGFGPAIQAITTNEFGFGIGASNTTNYGYSVYASARSPNAISIYGIADSATAIKAQSDKGIGLDAISTDSTAIRARITKGANTDPVILATHGGAGIAVDALSGDSTAIRARITNAANPDATIVASHAGSGTAVNATSNTGTAVYGFTVSPVNTAAIFGNNNGSGYGVRGIATDAQAAGVYGSNVGGAGVHGYSPSKMGVRGESNTGTALYGYSGSGYSLDIVGNVKIAGGNTNPAAGAVLTSVDANGNAVWKKQKIGFSVESINQNLTQIPSNVDFVVHFSTEEFDYGNNFNLYTGATPSFGHSTFVAPVSGLYHFDAAIALDDTYDNNDVKYASLRLMVNRGGNVFAAVTAEFSPVARTNISLETVMAVFSRDVKLVAGDIVTLVVKHNSGQAVKFYSSGNEFQQSYFDGHLVFEE